MAHRHHPDISLNLNVRGLSQSATLSINERCEELRKEGKTVYKLGLGQSPFPVPAPVIEKLKTNAHQKAYLPVRGLPELRETIASYLERSQAVSRTGEDVLVAPGSKQLMFILQLVYYGDLVIPQPSWVSYAPQAAIIGRRVRWVPTREQDDWHLSPDDLESICADDPWRPRIFILNYPANPTGSTYKTSDLKRLAKVAREHRAVLVSDEIYGELHHKGQHVSIARFYPEGTIVTGGLSKWCGAGGWRLGVSVFPRELRWLLDAMAVVASETFTSTSAPIQYAAVRAYEGGLQIERQLWLSRRILGALARYITKRLRSAGLRVPEPRGAFYLFPTFAKHKDKLGRLGIGNDVELCMRLLDDTGVALLPGSHFGCPNCELACRLAYVDFDGARALGTAEQLSSHQPIEEDFLRDCCPKVITAVERIGEWLATA
jgi:aspartate aminotransferase